MTDNAQRNAKKNMIFPLASQLVRLACGMVVPGLLLGAYGSESYGATQSIINFLIYIQLLDCGVSSVTRSMLYGPLAAGDYGAVAKILADAKRYFRLVSTIFVGYVLVLACGFGLSSRSQVLGTASTVLMVLAISLSTHAECFMGLEKIVLLQADQKNYLLELFSMAMVVVNTIGIVVLIRLGAPFLLVKLCSSLAYCLRPILAGITVRRQYPQLRKLPIPKEPLRLRWEGMGQHVAFFLHSYKDGVVLTLLTDLTTVAVHSVYQLVVLQIQMIATAFSTGMEAIFGSLLVREDKTQLRAAFRMYDTLISCLAVLLLSVTGVLVVPFVRVYTANITDANYIQPLFAAIYVLAGLVFCLRVPHLAMIQAAGRFRDTQWAAYGEAALNIGLSVIMVRLMGLPGVAVGSFVSLSARMIYSMIYLSRHILKQGIASMVCRELVNGLIFALCTLAGRLILRFLPITGYFTWVLAAIPVFLTALALVLGLNLLCYPKETKQTIRKLIGRKNHVQA